jgi:hypothetical protein
MFADDWAIKDILLSSHLASLVARTWLEAAMIFVGYLVKPRVADNPRCAAMASALFAVLAFVAARRNFLDMSDTTLNGYILKLLVMNSQHARVLYLIALIFRWIHVYRPHLFPRGRWVGCEKYHRELPPADPSRNVEQLRYKG